MACVENHYYEKLFISITFPIIIGRACYLAVECRALQWIPALTEYSPVWIAAYMCSGYASFLVHISTTGNDGKMFS